MSSIHSQTNLTNPHNIIVWRSASSKAIQTNPDSQAILSVHFALNSLHEVYVKNAQQGSNPLTVRHETFSYFQQAAITGYAPALFFEGLARLEGFGCQKDQTTGKALIQVAAVARACELAINFVQMRLGVAHLYGKGATQSFKQAIEQFKSAGEIAQPHLQLVATHLQKMRARMAPKMPQAKSNIVMLDAPVAQQVKLRM
jgi:hypothetical protein